jgi:hypothetical protein
MDRGTKELLDEGLRVHVARERQWWRHDRRGRWIVVEPGPGRLLVGASRHVRALADAITERRGRRFSSLSRARAFARSVGGEVRRWRRRMWRCETNPWTGATRAVSARLYLGGR